MRQRLFVLLSLLACLAPFLRADDPQPFEIKDGDRVLFLGDTLLEREGSYGYFETRMQEQFADRRFIVRNLAFSADTPLGWSRSSFDPAAKGFERLKEQIAMVKPTVVFLGYGMAASLQEITDRSNDPTLNPDPVRYGVEPMSAPRFKKELAQLMDAITEISGAPAAAETDPKPSPVRFVLLGPIPHEDLRELKPGLPDPASHNQLLDQYTKAIEDLAKERGARFVALDKLFPIKPIKLDWTTGQGTEVVGSPMHLTDNGIHLTETGYDVFSRTLASDFAWKVEGAGSLPVSPEAKARIEKEAALRTAIVRKNDLFFHRWRPANETYLFGFRKHEQGQNAKEIPMFDPLITDAEEVIQRLKKGEAPASPSAPPATAVVPTDAQPATNTAKAETPDLTPLPPPDFAIADGLKIELWAENPLLEKPTQCNWDPQGRLWVSSSSLYPMIQPGGEETDKILVLEDPGHTGKATNSTVFADGLLIPTGVVPVMLGDAGKNGAHRYGCYIGQSTELLYFEDTDGDGKADKKRIVLSGFGTEDTHHIVHTLRWGPDGRLYFDQSVYIHTHAETPWGVVRLNAGGVLAWDPRTERLEVFDKGLWNTWGHQFDRFGQHFQTDGAGSTGITWSFPGATYAPSEGARRTLPSISPGSYPKFCGLELISSPHFAADWQGNAITCDFRAHRIVRFGITDLSKPSDSPASTAGADQKPPAAQSGYVTQEMPDVVRTSDASFRPIDVKLGPDGALYVADWSNPVINHGEVDFRDPRRDHHHGRIWRISKEGAPPVKWESLENKKAEELFAPFKTPGEPGNTWLREQSLRVLAAKSGEEIESASHAFLKSFGSAGAPAYAQLNLLRTSFYGLHLEAYPDAQPKTPITPELVTQSIAGLSAESIAQTLPLLLSQTAAAESYFRDQPALRDAFRAQILAMVQAYLHHPHPRVRLGAIRILGAIPTAQSADLVLTAATAPEDAAGDPFLDFASWLSINELAKPWTEAIASGAWKIEGHEKQLEFGLNAIPPELAGATLAKILGEGKINITDGPWIEIIGRSGGPKELGRLLEALVLFYGDDCCPGRDVTGVKLKNLSEAEAQRAINALLEAARVRNIRPDGDLPLAHLAPHAPAALRPGLLRLAGYWKTNDALEFLPAIAKAQDAPLPARLAAIDGLRAYGGKAALAVLDPLTQAEQPLEIRRAALVAATQVNVSDGVARAAEVLPALPDESKALATWRELLQVQKASDAFAVKFRDPEWAKNMPKPVLLAGIRAAREAGKNGQSLLKALVPLAGVTEAQTMTEKDFQRIAASVKSTGNPANGELVYRRATSGCSTCHAIGGAGGKVGPDLTSIGASAPMDYLIESVLVPNAKVKEGFNAVTLNLKDGTQVTGIQARETAEEVFLRNIAGQDIPVAKANITGKTDVGSIMPAGIVDQYTDRERLDLYAFLGELGRPGPYDASKGAVARVWRLYPGSQFEQAQKLDLNDGPAVAYTLVDGRMLKDRLTEALQLVTNTGDAVFATTQLQVAAAGKTPIHLTGVSKAWLDGQPLAVASEPDIAPDLAAGVHTLTVQLDPKALPAELRADAPSARFLGN
jgi:putative heme-binding domain-containing protein